MTYKIIKENGKYQIVDPTGYRVYLPFKYLSAIDQYLLGQAYIRDGMMIVAR